MSELVLKKIHKRFGVTTAVEPTDLTFRSGELTALLGPSGCGKTTLLRMIAGLETPSSGNIELDGADITDQAAYRRKFGMVFQSFALFPHLSVEENIAYSLTIAGTPKKERIDEANELLDLVQLSGFGKRRISELSGGQRQRVAIARALAQKPRVFLLDEPMSALDAKLREEMQVELRLLQQRVGITTVVVTHDQKEALSIADNVVVMSQGNVEQIGSPEAIYNEPNSPFVASFIGKANLFDGRVEEGKIRIGNRELSSTQSINFLEGASVSVFARPEQTRIAREVTENSVKGKIIYIRNVGATLEIHVDSEIGKVLIEEPNLQLTVDYAVGQSIYIHLPENNLKIYPKQHSVTAA